MTTASGGLQMLFRGDADLLHGMFAAANLDRALVAAVMNLALIKTVTKTLFGAFEKQVFGDPCSHGPNLWAGPH